MPQPVLGVRYPAFRGTKGTGLTLRVHRWPAPLVVWGITLREMPVCLCVFFLFSLSGGIVSIERETMWDWEMRVGTGGGARRQSEAMACPCHGMSAVAHAGA